MPPAPKSFLTMRLTKSLTLSMVLILFHALAFLHFDSHPTTITLVEAATLPKPLTSKLKNGDLISNQNSNASTTDGSNTSGSDNINSYPNANTNTNPPTSEKKNKKVVSEAEFILTMLQVFAFILVGALICKAMWQ
jgi:hypothetical protein